MKDMLLYYHTICTDTLGTLVIYVTCLLAKNCTNLCDDGNERLPLLEEHLDHLRLVRLRRQVDGLLTEVICVGGNYICEILEDFVILVYCSGLTGGAENGK